ncbi:MAG: hypothetical protein M1838_000022 [Thelocarpon superellum]|nr:MAG: hypothetical protein M1838_000022 [Thelocarpon superellum]
MAEPSQHPPHRPPSREAPRSNTAAEDLMRQEDGVDNDGTPSQIWATQSTLGPEQLSPLISLDFGFGRDDVLDGFDFESFLNPGSVLESTAEVRSEALSPRSEPAEPATVAVATTEIAVSDLLFLDSIHEASPQDMASPHARPQSVSVEEASDGDDSEGDRRPDESTSSSDSEEEWSSDERHVEDVSVPDAEELQEIETQPECWAKDHAHFERLFFEDLDDPEHVPGPTGRIHWRVSHLCHTRDKPAKATLMTSPRVRIGDWDWTIKFFPRGNETDHMSVYLQCAKPLTPRATCAPPKVAPSSSTTDESDGRGRSPGERPPDMPPHTPDETQDREGLPVDPLTSDLTPPEPFKAGEIEGYWGIAAQFGVVMYNPDEPRVHVSRGNHHRFSTSAPDQGWTRFYGPHRQAFKRFRGQRRALVSNDTLAFTAYIRLIKDDTACLWEDDRDKGTFKAGVRALESSTPGRAYLVAALSTWASLPPFRNLINSIPIRESSDFPAERPKWMVLILQQLFHDLDRTSVRSPVSVQPVIGYLMQRGVDFGSDTEVVECWEILRRTLEREIRDRGIVAQMEDLFDGRTRRVSKDETDDGQALLCAWKRPSFRLIITSSKDVQTALTKALDDKANTVIERPPKVLQIELDRQEFDVSIRRWRKIVDEIHINEDLDLRPWVPEQEVEAGYSLHGMVMHEGDLRSGHFYHIAAHGTPGQPQRWLGNMEDHGSYRARWLTRKEVFEAHRGVASGSRGKGTEAVPHVLIYLRNDVVRELGSDTLQTMESPTWTTRPPTPLTKGIDGMVQLQVISSKAVARYAGRGFLDVYDLRQRGVANQDFFTISVPADVRLPDIQAALASKIEGIESPAQCQLWSADLTPHFRSRPSPCPEGLTVKQAKEGLLLLHVVPIGDLPHWGRGEEDTETTVLSGLEAEFPSSSSSHRPERSAINEESTDGRPFEVMQSVEGASHREENSVTVQDEGSATGSATSSMEFLPLAQIQVRRAASEQLRRMVLGESSHPDEQPSTGASDSMNQLLGGLPEHPTRTIRSNRRYNYIFIKLFRPKTQQLSGYGFRRVLIGQKVEEAVYEILDKDKAWVAPAAARGEKCHDLCMLWKEEPFQIISGVSEQDVVHDQDVEIIVVEDRLCDREKLEAAGHFTSFPQYAWYLCRHELDPFPASIQKEKAKEETANRLGGGYRRVSCLHGRPHGHGRMIYPDGRQYDGLFRAGFRHGQGSMTFENGDQYSGEWAKDVPEGQGKMIYSRTGNTYIGGFKDGRRHGRGVMHYEVSDDEVQLCQICYEGEMDSLFYDCGHVCACLACAKRLSTCPVCRRDVLGVVKIYRAC